MKTASTTYLENAKKQTRIISCKITIAGTQIEGDNIKNVSYRAEAEKHIGGIEYKTATVEVMRDIVSSLINQEFDAYLYIGFGSPAEYVSVGKFYTASWKENEKNKTVTIELLGMSNRVVNGNLPSMSHKASISIQTFTNLIQPDSTCQSLNGNLKYAYYSSNEKRIVLDDLAKAMNSIMAVDDNIVFKRYPASEASDTLSLANIIEVTGGVNGVEAYHVINLQLTNPSKSEIKELKRVQDIAVPPNVQMHKVGGILFDSAVQIVQMVIDGKHGVTPAKFEISSKSANIYLDNSGEQSNMDIAFIGSEFEINKISDNEQQNADSSILEYENTYLQDEALISNINTVFLTNKQVSIQYFGIPLYEVGDIITVESVGDVAISLITLDYDGGMRGTLEGVILDEKDD